MAKRTKAAMAGSRSKGRKFERDCESSLKQVYPEMYMTHEVGYIQQYDLRDDVSKIVVECKKHKSISWNQAKKWFKKLEEVTPENYQPYLIFQSNQQPVLVMYKSIIDEELCVQEFIEFFGIQFIKHKPTRRIKKNE